MVALGAAGCQTDDRVASVPSSQTQAALAPANAQMKAVLDELQSMNPKPIETLSPEEARRQPTPTQAVTSLLKKRGMSTEPQAVGSVNNRTVPTSYGSVPVRVYTPAGNGPFPVVVYIHGGGWVLATLDTYDASARALTVSSNAVVVSVDYRLSPEYKFPSAHEDCYEVTQWVMNNANQINGDAKRVAIAGESAGGNMATAVCLMSKDRGTLMPMHQVLIYPVTDASTDFESARQFASARPLSTPMLPWFLKHYLRTPADGANKYFSVLRVSDDQLAALPPATVVTAQIDPLRSQGQAYAEKLESAGVDVAYKNFNGVTHEFFGMASVVNEARSAQQFVADRLKQAFETQSGITSR